MSGGNNNPIGFFDSGSGGWSVWESVTRLLPHESTVYFGDHANIPYGDKTKEFIQRRVIAVIRYLTKFNIKLMVIACNTATVAGIEEYRRAFPQLPIVGVVPVVKTAAAHTKSGVIAVLSTAYTANSEYQKSLIAQFAAGKKVFNLGTGELVPRIEKGETDSPEIRQILHDLLSEPLAQGCDELALGCTHYPFLRPVLKDIVGSRVEILDSGDAVARQVERILRTNGSAAAPDHAPEHSFLTSGNADAVSHTASVLLSRSVVVTKVAIA